MNKQCCEEHWYTSFCMHMFLFLLVIHLGELLSYMVTVFNFLMNCQTVLQSGCTILQSHQEGMRVPISPHFHQHLLSLFLIAAILAGIKWYLIVVLTGISLTANDVEHLFMYLLDISYPRNSLDIIHSAF